MAWNEYWFSFTLHHHLAHQVADTHSCGGFDCECSFLIAVWPYHFYIHFSILFFFCVNITIPNKKACLHLRFLSTICVLLRFLA